MELQENPITPEENATSQDLGPTPEAESTRGEANTESEETLIDELAAESAELPEEDEAAMDVVAGEESVEAEREGEPVSKASILESLETLVREDSPTLTTEALSRMKQQFYHIRSEEQREEREKYIAEGGDPEAFVSEIDASEERFKELMGILREKKAAQRRQLEATQLANLERKRALISELNEIAGDADNVNRHFGRAREIQEEFTTVGEVPDTEASAVWKEYQDARERFYDQLKINKELRDYDFKKNLEEKQILTVEAERLASEDGDIIAAFRRLQDLHERWRRVGPVAKELREEVWIKFKDASAIINKKYQAHFEERKAKEQENETLKTALCEKVEALDYSDLKSYAAWDEMTKTILEAQAEWKTIGFASRKSNNQLFARFREACDKFFTAKATFFRVMKETFADNLAKKTSLCERAEALKESTDWRKTTEELVALQKEWKSIGPVAKKHSDAIWQRFLAACDYFFEQKKQNTSGVRKTEQANLKLKQEIIDRLAAMTAPDAPTMERGEAQAIINDLRNQWQEIGHVPFRLKDKLYDSYRQLLRDADRKFDLRRESARAAAFEERLGEMDGDKAKLFRERERLVRAAEQRRQEIQTYSNNLGFLSAKSGKGGDGLIKEMERRMSRLKEDLGELEGKIALLDSKLA